MDESVRCEASREQSAAKEKIGQRRAHALKEPGDEKGDNGGQDEEDQPKPF